MTGNRWLAGLTTGARQSDSWLLEGCTNLYGILGQSLPSCTTSIKMRTLSARTRTPAGTDTASCEHPKPPKNHFRRTFLTRFCPAPGIPGIAVETDDYTQCPTMEFSAHTRSMSPAF